MYLIFNHSQSLIVPCRSGIIAAARPLHETVPQGSSKSRGATALLVPMPQMDIGRRETVASSLWQMCLMLYRDSKVVELFKPCIYYNTLTSYKLPLTLGIYTHNLITVHHIILKF